MRRSAAYKINVIVAKIMMKLDGDVDGVGCCILAGMRRCVGSCSSSSSTAWIVDLTGVRPGTMAIARGSSRATCSRGGAREG